MVYQICKHDNHPEGCADCLRTRIAHLEQQAARLANLPGLPEHAIELAKKLLARQEANKHIDLDSKLAAADRGAIYVAYDLAHIVLNACYPPAPGMEGEKE